VTRAQQVAALDHGQPAQEIADALGCKVGSVYQARWERKHPVPLRKRPAPRAERAVALLAEYQAAGMDDSAAIRKVAREMGIGVNSVRDYRSRLTGTRRNYTEASDSGKPRPRCACSLTLFSPEELARGTCNNCLPTSAVELLGRRGDNDYVLSLPR
jgi:DNA-binding CsgD family transcriptional regulator